LANPISIPAEIAVGVGVGQAVSDIVEPKLRTFRNEQSAAHANVPLPAMQAALALIKGIPTVLDLAQEAAYDGFDGRRLGVLEQLLREYPGTAELLELWRRERLTRDDVDLALQRHGYPKLYRNAVLELFYGRLSPEIVATAVQRGILPNAGILPVGPPTGSGKVPPMPMIDLDPVAEAKAEAIDDTRLKVLARIVGLPASPDLAARMYFRSIIEKVDYYRAIAEGNTRNEWRDVLLEGFRQIPTAHDGIEGRLRGWIDHAAMYEQTARHGMSKADTDLLFKITGRPLSFHQVFIGERRGGVYDGATDAIDPAFLKALRESNVRPEWYNLAWAQRYTYPSAFVLRAMAEAGDLTQAETHAILLDIGWPPDLATKVAARWTAQAAGGASSYVGKAQTQLWNTTHSAFVAREASQGDVQTTLDYLGVPTADQGTIIEAWSLERDLTRKALSDANVRKAYNKGLLTQDVAVSRLEAMGYSFEDAELFLQL
jgi:hypothetical protein